MRLPTSEPRRVQLNLTSLIDVLFILIIFFVVSSTWREQPVLELDLPEAGTAQNQPVDDVVVTVDGDGSVYLGDRPVTKEALASELAVALGESPGAVVITADEAAPHGTVVHILDAARAQGASRVLLSALPGKKRSSEAAGPLPGEPARE